MALCAFLWLILKLEIAPRPKGHDRSSRYWYFSQRSSQFSGSEFKNQGFFPTTLVADQMRGLEQSLANSEPDFPFKILYGLIVTIATP